MKKILSFITLYFMLIVYLYSITFLVLPISSKIIFEAFSLLLCLKYSLRSEYSLKAEYKSLIKFFLLLITWDIITSTINGGYEFYLAEKAITAIISFYAAHIIYLVSKGLSNDLDKKLLFIVLVITSESLIALIMKIYPPLYSFLNSILLFDFGGFDMGDIYDVGRFTGIGNAIFFGVLPTCSLGLVTTIYLYLRDRNIRMKLFLLISFLLILVVSFFTARYSMFLGMAALLFYAYFEKRNIFKNIIYFFLLFLILYGVYLFILQNGNELLVKWAFGTFTGEGSDRSAEIVLGWWQNIDFDFFTFIIGDAHYVGLQGHGYYGGIDIGIFRQIFYGGVIGLVLNLIAHIKVLKYAYYQQQTREFKLMLSFLFVGYLIILTKGDANMLSFFVLYLVFSTKGIYRYKSV